jgi:hypothetical protein
MSAKFTILLAGVCALAFGASAQAVNVMKAAPMMMATAGSCAGPCLVQTKGNASNAHAGGTGVSVANSAVLSVVVSDKDGHPATNLGATNGNGSAVVTLPGSVVLFSNLNVPPGGCLLTPTEFYNWGNGSYNIRVVPFTGNPSCKWLAGEYHYVVQVKDGSGQVVGSGLGAFHIQ